MPLSVIAARFAGYQDNGAGGVGYRYDYDVVPADNGHDRGSIFVSGSNVPNVDAAAMVQIAAEVATATGQAYLTDDVTGVLMYAQRWDDNIPTTIANTTTETILCQTNLPGGVLSNIGGANIATGRFLRTLVMGTVLRNAVGTLTFRVRWGAGYNLAIGSLTSTFLTTPALSLTSNATPYAFTLEHVVGAGSGTTLGHMLTFLGKVETAGGNFENILEYDTAGALTADGTLAITAQWSAANANLSLCPSGGGNPQSHVLWSIT